MHAKNFIDLTGRKYGYYTVLHLAEPQITPNGKKRTMWTCRCICGVIKDVWAEHLKRRPNISCGCKKRTTLNDLTGFEINYIRVKSRAESVLKSDGKFRTMWNCICLICGTDFVAAASDIKSGRRYSCGCLLSKIRSEIHLEDFSGRKIGRLTVRERAPDYIKPSGSKEKKYQELEAYKIVFEEALGRLVYLKGKEVTL